MIALTSISPKHNAGDVQFKSVNSWVNVGLKVVSLNSKDEIATMKDQYPMVEFVEARTCGNLYKKPYVFINSFIELAEKRGYESVLIINSDIEIRGDVSHLFKQAETGMVIANRHDHNGDHQFPTRYEHGFDAFFIHAKFYNLFPNTCFVMGQTWWDYWLPYRFIQNRLPIFKPMQELFFHQRHPLQYDAAEWERMTKHFQFVEKYRECRPQHCTGEVFNTIQKHTIKI